MKTIAGQHCLQFTAPSVQQGYVKYRRPGGFVTEEKGAAGTGIEGPFTFVRTLAKTARR